VAAQLVASRVVLSSTELVRLAEAEIKMLLGNRTRPVYEADNLTSIYEPTVKTM
jgi:hypothetical protein